MFIALIIATSAILAMGQAVKYLVDNGFATANEQALLKAMGYVIALTCVFALATYVRYFLITKIGERVVADIRYAVFDHLLHLSPSFFETQKTGEVISRMTSDLTVLQVVIGSSLSVAVRHSLLLVGGLALLFISSSELTFYLLLIIPVIIFPVLILGKRVRRLSRKSQKMIAALSSTVDETLTGIRTVQAYAQEKPVAQGFSERVDEAFAAAMERVKMRALLIAVVIFLSFSSVAVFVALGGMKVLNGAMTAGELSSFLFYAVIVASSFGNISQVIGDVQRAAGAVQDLMDLMGAESEVINPREPIPVTKQIAENKIITFEQVRFAYPTKPGVITLDGVDITLPSGKTTAIVGPSGAGKTTLLQLMLRFYDPDAGRILLRGQDIRAYDLKALREHFAYVSQEPMIFSDSLKENIRFARRDASDDEVWEAIRLANVETVVDRLPNGLDTFLGEKGVRLSGGERQRVALARALLKNPEILLLDEATSALDAENERLVQEALETATEGRTTIVVAHRLATVRGADHIIVLEEGRVVAEGTHEKLLAQSELYRHLAELQFVA